MSLWGNKDLVGKSGSITINLSTKAITGTGTTFSTTGFEVRVGDVIVVGAGATYGHAVIASVTSNTLASVATTQYLIPHPVTGLIPAGTSYFITERPISSLEDSVYRAPDVKSNRYSSVFGVDVTEQQVAVASGSKYKPAHAGWVGVTTYVDTHGNLRVKTETLVAGSFISGDADDNSRYPNS
jgi:hypothetical protein